MTRLMMNHLNNLRCLTSSNSIIGWRGLVAAWVLVNIFFVDMRLATADDVLVVRNATIHTAAKAGTIENGSVLIRDGRIESVGRDIDIPLAAKVINANGKHVMPGIVDPYYNVSVLRNGTSSAPRTIVFRGRVFTVGGRTPPDLTPFVKLSDALDLDNLDWDTAIRSGITTLHLVTSGHCQTAIAKPVETSLDEVLLQKNGLIHTAATTQTKSLNVIRTGLQKEKKTASRSKTTNTDATKKKEDDKDEGGDKSLASKDDKSEEDSDEKEPPTLDENPADSKSAWAAARDGKSSFMVNANGSSVVLHVKKLADEAEKSKVVFVLTSASVYQTAELLDSKRHMVVLPPAIGTIPNSRTRFNAAAMLHELGISFAISPSMLGTTFRNNQDTPLFPIALLARNGLPADAALEAFTIGPAKLIGADSVVGSIEKGKYGNLLILDDSPFSTYTQIESVILEGKTLDIP